MKDNFKLNRDHWERCRQDNINLILQCQMQIKMAHKILELVEEEIKLFPKEEKSKKNPVVV